MSITTTSYGSFYNFTRSVSPMAVIYDYIMHADTAWIDAMETSGNLQLIEGEYRDAVNAALPDGMWLVGEQIIGYIDIEFDDDEIHDRIDLIDLAAIVDKYDILNTTHE